MDKSTINSIIETFDESYAKNSKALYDKCRSVDKFVELSNDYVLGLQADSFEKEIFLSYFDSHVRSMYRRDYEKEMMNAEIERYSMPNDAANFARITWAAIGGFLGSISGYAMTRNFYASAISGMTGAVAGLVFAHNGIKQSGVMTHSIPGTKEYEKRLRKELYDTLNG